MQIVEIVVIPLSRLLTLEASVVLVVRVERELELLTKYCALVVQSAAESPADEFLICFAIRDPSSDFVGPLNPIITGPFGYGLRISPVRSDGICNALQQSEDV